MQDLKIEYLEDGSCTSDPNYFATTPEKLLMEGALVRDMAGAAKETQNR
jgi:hypothetical protein